MARGRIAVSPGAALAGWVSVLVVLNVVGHPLVSGATFLALAVLAERTGHRRLVVVSLLVGLGLLLIVPGVAVVDGSFGFVYGAQQWHAPTGIGDVLVIGGSVLRIPAQVLASVLLAVVPTRALLAATSRLSPRTALLGGLAARLRPLLARDLRLVRDELASRGLRMGRGVPVGERARAAVALWEAAVSGMLDRAFQTAAALETRGYGVASRPTDGPLGDPRLDDGVRPSRVVDLALLLASVAFVVSALAARAVGAVAAPSAHVFGAQGVTVSATVVVVATLGFAVGLLPLLSGRATPIVPAPLGAVRTASTVPAVPLPLVLDEVSMTYPGCEAPSMLDVSLRVEPGELVVVTGASGSGKSTLLDVVTGVAPRSTGGTRSGRVRLGEHVLGLDRRRVDARICAVFQDPESQVLVGQVAEEVAFGLRHAGVEVGEIERRVLAMLDRLDLLHLARRDCSTLSGGELQRVLLAAALVLEPALLVLDEPTSQVDALSERRFWDAVDDARRSLGLGVVAVEHRLDHVLLRADRVVTVEGGRIVADVSAADALRHPLPAAYGGLVPNPVDARLPPRLAVHLPRLEVTPGDAGSRTLLRSLSFSLPPRSIVTLEGPNGTGKSTLLRTIRGLHPAPIDVRIDGVDRGDVGASVRRVAFLSQGAGALLPGRTVRHAVEETALRIGVDVGVAHAALVAAGLADRIEDHPGALSVGERQRLALVAATAHGAPVWLLDEPTRGMDAVARRWVACHVLAHAAAGGVVLVATHDSQLAAAIATHRLRLDVRTGPALVQVARDGSGLPLADVAATSLDGQAVEVDA